MELSISVEANSISPAIEKQTIFIEKTFNNTPTKPIRNSVTLRSLENGAAKLKRNHTMAAIASVYDVPRCHVRDPEMTRSCQNEINRFGSEFKNTKVNYICSL